VTALLAVSLVLVAASGAVVLGTKSPLAQAVVLSVHGLVLTVAFVAFGAPDVALSQLGVGAAVVPLMVLLALAKTRSSEEPAGNARPRLRARSEADGGSRSDPAPQSGQPAVDPSDPE
jgi:energy-converting hydrogenase B subunit D